MNAENTFQQLERTDGDKRGPRWHAAFKAQLTNDLTDDVLAYAARRAKWIERKTGACDPNLPGELLQDALGDTFAGVVTWDPKQASLALHLKAVIRSRTSHELERLERFTHLSVDKPTILFEQEVSEAIEAERANLEEGDARVIVDRVIDALRALGADDACVLSILDCYGDGVIDRRDIVHRTGMSSSTYHNAHRRLMRLVEELPEDIRIAAIHAMA